MKELDLDKKVYYLNQLDEVILDFEEALRLIILQYQVLASKRLFKYHPILQYKANKLIAEYDVMFKKYQDIRRLRFTPVHSNSN